MGETGASQARYAKQAWAPRRDYIRMPREMVLVGGHTTMKEKIWYWIARKLPRSLVMWCGYRMAAYATSGPWSHEEVPGIDMMTMFDRWIRG